jgi:hypothetical protein
VSQVATSLRRDGARAEAALSPEERLLRALLLGDSDVQLHAAANGLTRDQALAALRRQRSMGRRTSASAAGP